MNARKVKKKRNLFFQNFQLLNFDKKQMASNLFEFVKQSMMGTFSIKLTQIEKTGSEVKTYSGILAGYLKTLLVNYEKI